MSDHISGPRALADPIADITDVYAFPSPERPGHLVLVMNTLPFAQPSDALSDGLRLPLPAAPADRSAPTAMRCRSPPAPRSSSSTASSPRRTGRATAREQEGTCTTPAGETVPFRVNDEQGGEGHGVRVFAGPRWDPFIMDARAALTTIATGKLAFTDPASIFLDGKNVLEPGRRARLPRCWAARELVGVVAETLTRGRFNVRIERVGRPEVKNMMLAPKQFDPVNRDLEIRDLYNMEDAFHLGASYSGAYRARLNANLAFWDGLDGRTDWPPDGDGGHPLTELVLADYLVVDVTKPYAEQGSFLEIELAALARRGPRDLRRAGAQRRRDGHALHAADQRRQRARSSATASTGRRGRPRAPSPTSPRRTRTRPSRPSTTERWQVTAVTTSTQVTGLELDDIQSGALHERPSPYVGTYLLLRIDDRAAGRELVRRLHRSSTRDDRRPSPRATPGSPSPSPTTGLQALGVPQASLDSFAPEFRQGMAARAAELGDVGESSPEHWEQPLGTSDVHVALAALSPDAARLEAVAEKARRAHAGAPRRRGDLAAGLLPAADRAHLVRLQGRDRPARGRGQRQAAVQPAASAPLKAGEIVLGYPDETGELPPMPTPEVLGPQRHLRRLPQAAHPRRGLPAVPARQGREPRGRGAAGRQDGRPLAERRAAGGLARARRPGARRRPGAQQRLPLRRRPARPQVPRRRARAPREPARRARPRRQRQRPPAPHDPARHELRADAARGRARGRRRRPRDHLRLRRRAPAGASSSSSRPSGSTTASSSARPPEKDPLVGPNDGTGTFTIPQRPIRRRLQELPPFVVTRGGEYCFAPGLRAMRWLAELDT